ncbi:MAG: hypothetical protein LBI68_11110 [Azoarcus sp.]|nr:hypothetical protein [Azoarcus sp.]
MMAMPLAAGGDGGDASASGRPERIETLRGEAERLRAEADSVYQATEAACYKRFLVNSCIDEAKSERLLTVRRARELEAEAHRLDLAERNQAAAEAAKKAEKRAVLSSSTTTAKPSPDVATPAMPPEDARAYKPVARQGASAKKSRERADNARKRANARAKAARRDRERYDARIRELEDKKVRDSNGR